LAGVGKVGWYLDEGPLPLDHTLKSILQPLYNLLLTHSKCKWLTFSVGAVKSGTGHAIRSNHSSSVVHCNSRAGWYCLGACTLGEKINGKFIQRGGHRW
jgi:hypothetical protein